MAEMKLNIKATILRANPDTYQTSDLATEQLIEVLSNDQLGVTPTTIVSYDDTAFTLGALSIDISGINFNPNGNIGTSSFAYTIQDSIDRTSTTRVYVTTI